MSVFLAALALLASQCEAAVAGHRVHRIVLLARGYDRTVPRAAHPPAMCGKQPSYEVWPQNVHTPFTREEDLLLWRSRDGDLAETARKLGRGPKGVAARLKRLHDPTTAGYRRLFGDEKPIAPTSLRPVRECLQRILWDKALPAKHFMVGYRDRYRSTPAEVRARRAKMVREMLARRWGPPPVIAYAKCCAQVRFDQPNKGEGHSIAGSARLFVLALPEHRIEWLKYKRQLVWHKVRRPSPFCGRVVRPGKCSSGNAGTLAMRE